MCIAVVVGGHGQVATAHQLAPWSRGSDLLSPTAVGAAFRSTSVGGLAHFQSDMGIAQRSLIGIAECTPRKLGSALSYCLFGWSWQWPGRAVDVPNPRAARAAESQRFINDSVNKSKCGPPRRNGVTPCYQRYVSYSLECYCTTASRCRMTVVMSDDLHNS